ARKSSEDLKWALFNINGTRIMGIDVILTEDSDIQNFKLLTKDLTPGMYYLCVGNSIVSKTLKLIKN
ncbi:MAG: T9SS type A sorting domain-containing protein, partial [Bacteroidota bacterium]